MMDLRCIGEKWVKLRKGILAGLGYIITVSVPANAGHVIGNFTTDVIVSYKLPTCDISIPTSVDFGFINKGEGKTKPLRISVTCQEDTKTAVTATVRNGTLSATEDSVSMMYDSGGEGPLLRIKENNGSAIYLNGDESKAFCRGEGIGERFCDLTAKMSVSSGDAAGKVKATLNFQVIYPN